MKIGLDLHGVLTDLPEFFKFFCESFGKNGGEIFIITGGSIKKARKELSKMGFVGGYHYHFLFSILDYHIEKGSPTIGHNEEFDNPEFDDELWDKTKGEYCKQKKIDLMIDDSMIYQKYFTTPFARLWTKTNTPKNNKPKRHLE